MEIDSVKILRWPYKSYSPTRLLINAGVGLSFVLATFTSVKYQETKKHHSSQTVIQVECHSEHLNDKITELTASIRRCKGCGQSKSLSAFASKGRDRPSALCKNCDNERRRSSYSPKVTPPDWDRLRVSFDAAPIGDQIQLASLIWEMLIEHKIVSSEETDFKDEPLDSLLNRRSAIDGIIERGTT